MREKEELPATALVHVRERKIVNRWNPPQSWTPVKSRKERGEAERIIQKRNRQEAMVITAEKDWFYADILCRVCNKHKKKDYRWTY